VCSQLAHFGILCESRVAMGGPDLRITAAASQTIGMALRELITNANKYGALSAAPGHVDIVWSLEDTSLACIASQSNGANAAVRPSWPRRGGGSAGMCSVDGRKCPPERTLHSNMRLPGWFGASCVLSSGFAKAVPPEQRAWLTPPNQCPARPAREAVTVYAVPWATRRSL
jgi:hypothetical protein